MQKPLMAKERQDKVSCGYTSGVNINEWIKWLYRSSKWFARNAWKIISPFKLWQWQKRCTMNMKDVWLKKLKTRMWIIISTTASEEPLNESNLRKIHSRYTLVAVFSQRICCESLVWIICNDLKSFTKLKTGAWSETGSLPKNMDGVEYRCNNP